LEHIFRRLCDHISDAGIIGDLYFNSL